MNRDDTKWDQLRGLWIKIHNESLLQDSKNCMSSCISCDRYQIIIGLVGIIYHFLTQSIC